MMKNNDPAQKADEPKPITGPTPQPDPPPLTGPYEVMDMRPLTGISIACDNPPPPGAIELFTILLATKVLPPDAKLNLENGLHEVRIEIFEKPLPLALP